MIVSWLSCFGDTLQAEEGRQEGEAGCVVLQILRLPVFVHPAPQLRSVGTTLTYYMQMPGEPRLSDKNMPSYFLLAYSRIMSTSPVGTCSAQAETLLILGT